MSALKSWIRRTGTAALGPVMRHVPIGYWPGAAADLFEIKLPCNVRPQPVSSPAGGANINAIFDLLNRVRHLPGDIAECGVFRGSTLIPMALRIAQSGDDKHVIGFDSFEGFDAAIAADLLLGGDEDPQKRQGGFSQTSLGFVAGRVSALGLTRRVTLIPGYFDRTLPTAPERRYSFVHLDCDIHASYQQCLTYFFPRLVPGGIILLDEYNDPPWPGCNKAVDDFLAARPETVQPIVHDGFEKYFIVKSL